MGKCSKSRSSGVFSRVFWGLFFLAAAAYVALSVMGIWSFGINVGILILGIFLIAIIIKSLVSLAWFGVFIPAAVILTLLNYQTDLVDVSGAVIGASYIVAVLAAIGFSILFHRRSCVKSGFKVIDATEFDEEIIDNQDDSDVQVRTHFGSTTKYVNSSNLRKVVLDCSFGAQKIYFDDAKISKSGCEIIIQSNFSGIELYIPREWDVTNNTKVFAGGVEEKNRARLSANAPEIKLVGELNFSGIEIHYV